MIQASYYRSLVWDFNFPVVYSLDFGMLIHKATKFLKQKKCFGRFSRMVWEESLCSQFVLCDFHTNLLKAKSICKKNPKAGTDSFSLISMLGWVPCPAHVLSLYSVSRYGNAFGMHFQMWKCLAI